MSIFALVFMTGVASAADPSSDTNYTVKAVVSGTPHDGDPQLGLMIDGKMVGASAITARHDKDEWVAVTFDVAVPQKPQTIAIAFLNGGDTKENGKELYVQYATVNDVKIHPESAVFQGTADAHPSDGVAELKRQGVLAWSFPTMKAAAKPVIDPTQYATNDFASSPPAYVPNSSFSGGGGSSGGGGGGGGSSGGSGGGSSFGSDNSGDTPAAVPTAPATTVTTSGTPTPTPTVGVCGAANATPTTDMPSTNLCGVGTASAVTGTGGWTWSCAGTTSTTACAAPAMAPGDVILPAGEASLTFSDEFSDGTLNRAVWTPGYVYTGTINSELEYYSPDAFVAGPGYLRIRGDTRQMNGFNYTSGAMTTFGSFQQTYGYFEMRARVPKGNGFWPAFWMTPIDQSWPPEIDIFEILGQNPTIDYMTYHWSQSNLSTETAFTGSDLSADFHIYGMDWRPGVLNWYVDGILRKTVTGATVPAIPMYITANLAIGGNWPVPPDATTPFPSFFDIDYIRAYQYNGLPNGTTVGDHQFLKSSITPNVASAGQQVTVNLNAQVNTAQAGWYLQGTLYNNAGSVISRANIATAASLTPGPVSGQWVFTLPSNLPAGMYHLSFGLFHQSDWSEVDYLGRADMLQVQ